MTFNVYSGEIASNSSVNVTKHGSFEAESEVVAQSIIHFNVKHRYCDRWQIGLDDRDKYVECMNRALRFGMFVCKGDPFRSNLVWGEKNAVIAFFS